MTARAAADLRHARRRDTAGLVVTALMWAVVTGFVGNALQDPPKVDHITIENPQRWRVNVDASDKDQTGWVGIGGVDREHEQTFHSVLDQGDTWVFRFSYGGQHAEIQVTGFQLEQNNWHVTVPDELADRLRAAGLPETPR